MKDETTKAMFEYLTKLQEIGKANGWGAACRLQKKFKLSPFKAMATHLEWLDKCKGTVRSEG